MKLLKYYIIILSIIIPAYAMAAKTIDIKPGFPVINLGNKIDILEDSSNSMTLNDVISKPGNSNFKSNDKKYPCFGYTRSAYWLHFSVKNITAQKISWLLRVSNSTINKIDLYITNRTNRTNKLLIHKKSGNLVHLNKREIPNNDFIFKINSNPHSVQNIYIRLKSDNFLYFYISMWTGNDIHNSINNENIMLGIIFGAFFILLIYNVFLLIYIRSRSYLYFILNFLFTILFYISVNGFAYQYFWPQSHWFGDNAHLLFISISQVFLILFSKEFLETKIYDPLYNKVITVCIAVTGVSLFFPILFDLFLASIFTLIVIYVVMIALTITSIRILYHDHRPARFYVYAMIAFWTGSLITYMRFFSIVPEPVVWLVLLSILAKFIFFSLGLTDRINYMKRELETLNVNLENIVENRTEELNSAIDVLEKNDTVMQTELELAGDIQKGILPEVPFYSEGIKIDAYYRAMKKVGGDFFDIFKMQGGYLGILIADASGHGMPAAFITALAKISFSEVMQQHLFPSDIFTQVNNNLVEIIKTDDFLTAFLIVISPNFEVFYCNASHQKTMVLRNETLEITEWDTNGLFLGAFAEATDMYEDKQDQLNYGDRMLLYSDGIVEAKSVDNEAFGEDRLMKIFKETSYMPIEEVKDKIIAELNEFSKGREQFDDISLVLVEIDAMYKEVFKFRDRGFKLLGEGNYEEAIVELQKSLQINPHDEKSHLYIGECYLKNGNDVKAVEHLKYYLNNNDVDANVWHHLAEAYFYLGEYQMSYNASLKSIQIKHNFIDAMVICGFSLKNLNRNKEAVDIWKKIQQIDPENEIAKKELYYAETD